MPRRFGILALVGALVLVTGNARAQVPAGMEETVRPATTSIYGDTGLWFVPTGEVLRGGTWSLSAYRINWDVRQGFTDISHFEGTFAVGVADRAELFGAIRFDTRIDRDTRPIFGIVGDNRHGGIDVNYPFVREGWTGDDFGDTFLGGKLNLLSESREAPVALALRGMVKVPTGSADSGAGTGKMDAIVDLILSKEVARVVELSGHLGYRHRGDPDEVDLSSGMPFGLGAQFPTRSPLKFTTEWWGERYFDDFITRTGTATEAPARLVGIDGSIPPVASQLPVKSVLMVGATWQADNGFFAGAGVDWSFKSEDRSDFPGHDSDFGTRFGWQFRLGYHPGVAGRPIPLPPPPPPPPPPAEHTLTVDAQCDPCTVEVGATSNVTATAQDSIGCVITYRWSAPTGTFENPAQQNTVWTAPNTPGTVPVTVTGTCPTDNLSASDTVNIQVVPRPVQKFEFEDVYFDFDRFSLTEAAQRVLAQAVEALRADPTLRVRIEGHTCNIGTAEYNLALGDRRARSVQEYLVANGIAADRLTTVSFGEEQPKHDNSREETRRLNRRAALTVQLVGGGN